MTIDSPPVCARPASHKKAAMGRPKIAAALDSADETRLALAAQFVPAGARVLDLSGGNALKRHLPHGCTYKSAKTKGALAASDVVVMLDLLDRIDDAEELFGRLVRGVSAIVLNYHPRDLNDGGAGANDRLGFYDLTRLFDQFGFRIASTVPLGGGEVMLRLAPNDGVPAIVSRIAVLAEGDSFGDRLGLQLLSSVLPGEADVDYLTAADIDTADGDYDLAIIGAGNALTPSMLKDSMLGLIGRAKASIGIFGTQHRELFPRASVERLIGKLDVWYARHNDDLLLYGPGNGVHLGDWLIDQFPLGSATDYEPLTIGPAEMKSLGLDAIPTIRRHRSVVGADRAALICALTSADMAAWRDESLPPGGSAEFRSLLLDIFGRSYPAGEFFLIDRDPVQRYRAKVHANIAALRERIAAACVSRVSVAA
jgi:hypothetical protein